LFRNGEGSIELNNCFNSATCTWMTAQLGGSGSPADWLGLVAETAGIMRDLGVHHVLRIVSMKRTPKQR
jgi:hypothetical protein